MMEFLKENVEIVQIAASLTTTFVWLVYLHIFLSGYIQQRRSSILINRGGGQDMKARCLVSNMGAQPAYLLDVLASLDTGEEVDVASVVDREELRKEELEQPTSVTGQGPIPSGGYVDIGTFEDVARRAGHSADESDLKDRCLKLVAVCATNQANHVVAAAREFDLVPGDEGVRLAPRKLEARQIRSRRLRRKITSMLERLERKDGDAEIGAEFARL
ncbi:hypothetical protein FIU85_18185 [Roseovarius sp. THAF8]|uniref:hypothetical protein n=1 Tax=Roseovarius sp. THAF8 TaxID=2587846 RepID=UPI0012A828A1|nr:hypothetical protein [Roseovarius sp. THAF8]QFT99250.1 hypothetical protein FIU85_18185 [Roseovarius sp. THAF8]